jgi:hypothetical protein
MNHIITLFYQFFWRRNSIAVLLICAVAGLPTASVYGQQEPAGSRPAASSVATPAPASTKPAPATTSKQAAAPASMKLGSVTVSGSLRLRLEDWDWFDTTAADGDYTFGAALLRLAIGQQKEKFDWQVEGAFPLLVQLPEHAIAPAPQGQLGVGANYYAANLRQDGSAILKQAFVRIKGLAGDKSSSLRIGRFEFADGSEMTPTDATLATVKRDHIAHRLIGPFTFTHIGRSFDGAQYVRNNKASNFTLLAARPTEGVFQLRGHKELDVDFYYGAFTRPFKSAGGEGEARLFAMHYHDGRGALKTDNRSALARAADGENIRLTSVGGHYIGAYKAAGGKLDVLLWGVGQFGGWGRLDHSAGAIAVEAGIQPGRFAQRIKPWLRAGYFRSTGDGDPTDDRHTTFFQGLPTPRIYARFPFYNLMNNQDIFAQLRLKPHARVGVRTDLHYLRLSNSRDLWYQGGGAFQKASFGYVGRPSGGRKTLGTMLDMSVDYSLASRTSLTFYLAGVTGSSVARGVYPLGNSARFAYLELLQRF